MKTLTKLCCTLALVMALGLVPGLAAAQTVIDLTVADASGTHNGAVFIQQDITEGAGTGILDPFYQIKSNDGLVAGVNTGNATVQFQTFGGPWTTALLLSTVTQREVGGILYREFVLDINQTPGNGIYAMTDVQVYTDDQDDLNCLDPTTQTWGICDMGGAATLRYWLDGGPDNDATVKLNYSLETGSGGNTDMTFLAPDADFGAGDECDYGAAGCSTYVYLYSEFGANECPPDNDCSPNNDGFEEWATLVRPFIRLSKTADGTTDETHTWDITKVADPVECDLFVGDSCDVDYTITVDETVETSNELVTGIITIEVPAKLPDGDEDAEDANITSLDDVFRGVNATVEASCATPFVVAAGTTTTCSYELVPPDTDDGFDNEVTADVEFAQQTFEASATVNFSVNPIGPDVVNVTDEDDDETRNFGPLDDGETAEYTETFTCVDDSDFDPHNTATIDETGDSDDATVDIDCYALTVTKDAETKLTRTFPWTIEKTVTPETWDLFTGDTGTSEYEVTWTKGDGVDSGFMVMGEITIANAHPTRDAELTAVVDVITPGDDAATVDCDGETTVPADDSLVCTYMVSLDDDSGDTNTATATQQNYAFDSSGGSTTNGTTDYSGTADVDFTGAEVMEINASVDIVDTVEGDLALGETTSGSTTYEREFACNGDEGTHDNVASVIGDDGPDEGEEGDVLDSDDASVTVNCYQLEVTKDAETTHTRTWTWTIDKSADQTSLQLSSGQLFTVNYEVTVDATSSDNDWAVSGTITIANEHPTLDATLTDVVDAISDFGGTVTVDCGGVTTVPADDSIDCTYSAGPEDSPDSNPFGELNTATATQQNYDYDSEGVGTASGTTDYDGTADVAFGDPTSEIDECIDVSDTNVGDLGTVCADQAPETFNYSLDFGQHPDADVQLECGENTHMNVADFVTNDNEETGEDDWTVIATVDCDPSCTLTQGYWKTHNESFKGGAPPDDTWLQILPSAENSPFFLSGDTWFGVFWTPPKGNAYYNLAHQYMAAVLNTLNGASVPGEVQTALDDATGLFNTKTPADIAALKGKNGKAERKVWIDLAGTLGSYNEGDIGPGHCDEDGSSENGRVLTEGTAENAAEAVEVAETQEKAAGTDPEAKAIDAAPELVEEIAETPDAFAVGNYPDPFNPTTTIRLELPEAVQVSIIVYDVLGRQVARVADGVMAAGVHEFAWNASNLPSGTYFYMVRAGQFAQTKTMVLTK